MATDQTTKLSDFNNNVQSANQNNENQEDQPRQETEDQQSDNTESNDPACPYYTEGLRNCKERLDDGLIDDNNLEEIGCGFSIDYLSEDYGAKLTEGTLKRYSGVHRNYVEFLHENQTVVINAGMRDVKRYFKKLARDGVTEKTARVHLSAIKSLYKHIEIYTDWELELSLPMLREEINLSKYRFAESVDREPLEKHEVKELYDAMETFRDRLMTQVAVEVGGRNNAIRGIKISDVDLENREIEVHNKKSGGTNTIPINDELALLIRRWIDQERTAYPGTEDNELLFPAQNGGKLTSGRFNKIVKDAAEAAGIQETMKGELALHPRQKEAMGMDKDRRDYHKVTPHTLRHTFNYLLDEAGLPLKARSEAMDHENKATTEEHYGYEETSYHELMRELFTDRSLLD